MEHIKRILSYTRRALDDYQMIKPGDKIAVGVSAGKDSLTLLCAMAELRRFYPVPFELVAVTVDMGFEGADFSEIQKFCEALDVKYVVESTQIAKIIFDVRKESNPCSLCAKLRRGMVNDTAKKLGCNKVAYARLYIAGHGRGHLYQWLIATTHGGYLTHMYHWVAKGTWHVFIHLRNHCLGTFCT